MKTYAFKLLIIIYKINTGSKRRHTEDTMIINNTNELHIYNDLFKNSKSIIVNNLSSFNVVHLNHSTSSKYKRRDDNDDTIKELFNFLDCVNFNDPSIEELNKCAPVTLDYDSLKELLGDKQDKLIDDQILKLDLEKKHINYRDELVNIQYGASKYLKSSLKLLNFSSVDNRKYSKLELNVLKEEKLMWDTLKSYIKDYITSNISKIFSNKYLKRLRIIEEACNVLDNHKLCRKEYFVIFDCFEDVKIVKNLKEMILIFNKCTDFNQETFNRFSAEFDLKIHENSSSFSLHSRVVIQDTNKRKVIFFSEFAKLYRYVCVIPELLTLGGLYLTKPGFNIIFFIHLINIFIENVKISRDNRFFILCMVAKALKCFYRNNFDIFMVSNFEIACSKSKHELYYLLWEFNCKKRQDLGRRISKGFEYMYNNKSDFKIVVLIFLYQTRILDKYCKIDVEGIKLIKELIDKVKNLEDCVGCLLDEYLCILAKIK